MFESNLDLGRARKSLAPPFPARLLGLEQEFEIFSAGKQVDFRRLIHEVLAASGNAVSPAGSSGYFLPTGTLLISDGWEAELAGPPEAVEPGLFRRMPGMARARQEELLERFARFEEANNRSLEPRGYSTHLSVSSTGVDLDDVVRVYAQTMAPAMMLFLDITSSPGLLIRSRTQRFEVGGDYVAPGDLLGTAGVFFVASFLAVVDAVVGGQPERLPLWFDASRLEVTRQRRGLYVDRGAFGDDLYQRGRDAELKLADGRTATAQRVLEDLWATVQPYAEGVADADELALVVEAVSGVRELPSEHSDPDYRQIVARGPLNATVSDVHPFATSLRTFEVARSRVSPEIVTWDYIVYRVDDGVSTRFLNVPRERLADWLEALDSGTADSWIGMKTMVDHLAGPSQAREVGIFSTIDRWSLSTDFDDGKKYKKKKTPDQAVCEVRVVGASVRFCMPEVTDNLRLRAVQEPPRNAHRVAHDVFVSNGTFIHEHTDHEVRGRNLDVVFTRHYRSGIEYDGPLGQNFDHAYNIRLVLRPGPAAQRIGGGFCETFDPKGIGGSVAYYEGNGRVTEHPFASWEIREVSWCDASFTALVTTFAQNNGDSFEIQHYAVIDGTPPPAAPDANFFRITYAGGTRILANCFGRAVEIRSTEQQRIQLQYGLPFDPSTKYFVLKRIVDSLGRLYEFDYELRDEQPRMVSLRDPWARQLQFAYDDKVQLNRVTLVTGAAGTPQILYRFAAGPRAGLLTEIVKPVEAADGSESWLENSYDASERVVSQRVGSRTSSSGGTYRIAYIDELNLLVTDRVQTRWNFQLRNLGGTKVLETILVTDEVGTDGTIETKTLSTRHQYDSHFHISSTLHPSGIEERHRYRNFNAVVSEGEELDDVKRNIARHNDLGRDSLLRHERIGAGGSPSFASTFEYEWLFGAMTASRTPNGTTLFRYEHSRCEAPQYNANPTRIEYPRQQLPNGSGRRVIEEFDYAPGGIVQYRKDPDGVEQHWTIDQNGWATRFSLGGLVEEETVYDVRGNAVSSIDSRGNATTFSFDARDLVQTSSDPLDHVTRFSYDLNDRRTADRIDRVDDPSPLGLAAETPVRVVDRYFYDILGNRLSAEETGSSATEALSRTWRSTYDGEERLVLVESARATAGERSDAKTRNRYNARGLLSATITADGGNDAGTIAIYCDDDGRPALNIDPVGGRTVTRYDGLGRPIAEEWPNGAVRHLEYQGPGLSREWVEGPLSTRPGELGGSTVTRVLREIQFVLDATQRPIKRTHKVFDPRTRSSLDDAGGDSWIEQSWLTAAGRLSRQRDPSGNETIFAWNAQGRVDRVTLPAGHTLTYRYDGELVKSVTTMLRPEVGVTGPLPPSPLELVETQSYDTLGRPVRQEAINGTVVEQAYDSLGNVRGKRAPLAPNRQALTQQFYDPLGRLRRQVADGIQSPSNSNGLMVLTFEYDLNDNVRTLIDDLGRPTRLTYDGRDDMLTSAQLASGLHSYSRRPDGRIRQVSSSVGASTDFEYSPTGSLTAATYSGRGTRGVRQRFGYDGLDRLYWSIDSNGEASARVQSYRSVDSLGRPITERTVVPEHQFDKSVNFRYRPGNVSALYPDGFRVTRELDSDGNSKRLSLDSAGVVLENWHQGPGRRLQTHRALQLLVEDPAERFDLTVRTSERFDAEGRPNFRTVHVMDEINRPNQQNFVPLSTQPERTRYGVNGLPQLRDYGTLSQPGTSVESTTLYDGLARTRVVGERQGREFANLDYDWDGTGRLLAYGQSGRTGDEDINLRTTIRYRGRQRIDETRNLADLVSTTTWSFDPQGRLSEATVTEPEGRRRFAYDASDRLTEVDVSSDESTSFLYDAFGRVVVREAGDEREFFCYDGLKIVEEFDADQAATRRYVHDERGQVVHYDLRAPDGTWQSYYPMVNGDGSPWILLTAKSAVETLPERPGDQAAAITRARYFREALPLIVEEHRARPFETGVVVRYDYSDGTAEGEVVDASVMPIDSGGRRYFAAEGLFLNGPRFYDPALRSYITPDHLGAWGHPMAYGNPYAYAGNNPVAFGDDGRSVILGVLAVVAVGALIGAGISAARQGVQLLEGSRDDFSVSELGFSALFGGALAPVLVFAPELAIVAVAGGAGHSVYQYSTGQIGGFTLAFDAATLALPFAFKGVRASVYGRGSLLSRGPAAGLAARRGRFEGIGQWLYWRVGLRRSATDGLSTLEMLRELGGRELDDPRVVDYVDSLKPEMSFDNGQQGTVYGVREGTEQLVIKVFDRSSGADAAGEVAGLYEYQAAIAAAEPGSCLCNVRVVRVRSIGRTSDGRSFIIKEFAKGDIPMAMRWLERGGVARLLGALRRVSGGYHDVTILPLENNVAANSSGQMIIFDPQ